MLALQTQRLFTFVCGRLASSPKPPAAHRRGLPTAHSVVGPFPARCQPALWHTAFWVFHKKSVWGGRRGQHKGRQPGVSHISTDGHVKTHAGHSLTQVSTDGVPGAVADSHFGHVELCAGYAGLPPGGPAASAPSAPGRGGAETGSTPAVCGDVCCHPPTSCGVSVPDGAPCMPGLF